MTTKQNLGVAVLLAASTVLTPLAASAQGVSDDVIRIGIMNDQSGPYADNCGPGSVASARLAVEDAGGEINGKKIEIVVADDQNKPDIGVAAALKWVEQDGVDAIVGCSASSIAAAISDMMNEKKKPYLLAGSAASFFTNDKCNAMTTQWMQDTYAMAKATINSLLQAGNKKFYFITVDYTFGKVWQEDSTKFIEEGGGEVIGSVLHPLNSNDFSSYLLQAQASGAEVIALANAGNDLGNAIKQAAEFGITQSGQNLAPLGMFINNAHSIGLDALQGVRFTTPTYWDLNDGTREFTKRYQAAFNDRYPNEAQMTTYSAVAHYLKAVAAAGTDEGDAVMAKMRETPINDFQMDNVSIRADGQVMRPSYAVRVKSPDESKAPYDYYEVVATLDPEQVWRSPENSSCPLMKQ
ncbi:MAG: ABC transporter permease [Phyllobacteriaceae bacterium]|nr:ABC transporter permease [Phyllobacteriaceae bacterium]MBA90279.1 ABC transporter permease [Phyllobacteriaceae bacterium]